MNTWTVHVENFGKIKSAEIETAPLTLFVGDNNSGKSYMMTLMYGLINLNFYYEQYEFNEQSENYLKCVQFIDRIYHTEVQTEYSFRQIEMEVGDVSA
ncbi:MAG: ATP-binding protein, partial [Lachnospiraceae bacterium]|nr:ATP-binding protein [Lachnospiraceae bacterium]